MNEASELAEILRSLEGFGSHITQMIGGKYQKRRYACELGTYDRNWSIAQIDSCIALGPSAGERLTNVMAGVRIESLTASGSIVLVTFESGAVLRVVGSSESDDMFYIYAPNGTAAFYVPSSGWVIERSAS